MRQIGSLPLEEQARRLADYLLTRKITSRVDQAPEGWIIWVHDEDKVAAARQALDEFRLAPEDPRYEDASARARSLRRQAERVQREHARQSVYLRDRWLYRSPRKVPVSLALIAISVGVFTLQVFDNARSEGVKARLSIASKHFVRPDFPDDGLWHRERYRENLEDLFQIREGEVWRLVTPMFLHFGIIHLVFNMFWLADLGGQFEMLRKSWRLAFFIAGSSAFSNLVQYFWDGPFFGGMSGVVYALFGYTWMKTHFEPNSVFRLNPGAAPMMLIWLVFCMTGSLGPIANAAHLAGLVFGVCLGVLPHLREVVRL